MKNNIKKNFEKEKKEVEDFLKYDNKKGRLYYLDIELGTKIGPTDFQLVRLKVFGKINTNVFNFFFIAVFGIITITFTAAISTIFC